MINIIYEVSPRLFTHSRDSIVVTLGKVGRTEYATDIRLDQDSLKNLLNVYILNWIRCLDVFLIKTCECPPEKRNFTVF